MPYRLGCDPGCQRPFAFGGQVSWLCLTILIWVQAIPILPGKVLRGWDTPSSGGKSREVTAAWRYLYYDMPSDKRIKDMDFSGPVIGATF